MILNTVNKKEVLRIYDLILNHHSKDKDTDLILKAYSLDRENAENYEYLKLSIDNFFCLILEPFDTNKPFFTNKSATVILAGEKEFLKHAFNGTFEYDIFFKEEID
jgi:hypothetical protein